MEDGSVVGTALSALSSLAFYRGARDDDAVDRLNHLAMYGLLLVLSVCTGAKQYVGEPIFCWVPAQYREKFFKRYVNNHCWVQSMYNIPFDETIPRLEDDRYYNDVSYYRWASVFFAVLAVMCRLPNLLWKQLKLLSGSNLERISSMVTDTVLVEDSTRDTQLGHVAEFVHRWVMSRNFVPSSGRLSRIKRRAANLSLCFGKRSGYSLVLSYLFIKLLYLGNVVGQVFFISCFLKINYWTYGIQAVSALCQDGEWEDQHTFPRVALCDLKIRQQRNVQTFTVQCVLSINLFLEKMFLLVWFCLMGLMIFNVISLLKWSYQLLSESQATKFVIRFSGVVLQDEAASPSEKKAFQAMVRYYLRRDGVFLMKMVATNTSDLLMADLLKHIMKRYRSFQDRRKSNGLNGKGILKSNESQGLTD